jgi:hypothetical protein
MNNDIIYVKKKSDELTFPLFGLDFIGVVDRGTNVIELKPLTLCNLRCKYCFVSAGDYETNFIVDPNYLIEKVKEVMEVKGPYDIEIHIAPYGESLLYSDLFYLIKELWNIEGIETISMQSNALLLNEEVIKNLENVNLTRINISLNTLNQPTAEYLCDCRNYQMDKLLENINSLLNSNIDVLLAPVWFPGKNDEDIGEIIKFVKNLRNRGHSEKKIQIGIQKYLLYRTGRKLKNVRPKSWDYFYRQLSSLEKAYNIKLKLGPKDFGIHKRARGFNFNVKKNDSIKVKIISKGRWKNECIGKITNEIGIKVLLKKPLIFSEELVGKKIKTRVIKANYKDNIFTAYSSG